MKASLAKEAQRQGIVESVQAEELAECCTEVYSTDEMTWIQALGRKYPDKPAQPEHPALHEFEYIRHETISLIAFLRVADGSIQASYLNSTRNEKGMKRTGNM